jgi:hypothetical protein
MKSFLLISLLLGALTASADPVPTAPLADLDKVKTCDTDTKKVTANLALSFLENFRWWHIKDLYESVHPDYVAWHASRTYSAVVAVAAGKDPATLPYKNGQVTKSGFIYDLAMIAYTNDVPKYKIDINRLECVGTDTVVISSIFNGMGVRRNAAGEAQYQLSIDDAPTRFTIMIKDGLIYKLITDIEDKVSVDLANRFTALIATGVPNVVPGTIPPTTFQMVLDDFNAQAQQGSVWQ